MATKSTSGLTVKEREDFLREHGFVQVRTAKGSHDMWEHAQIKALAGQGNKMEPPAYLMSGNQRAWEIPLCSDPAGKTWHKITKHAAWCKNTAATFTQGFVAKADESKVRKDFRVARAEDKAWRQKVKGALKMGHDVPTAPQSYTSRLTPAR